MGSKLLLLFIIGDILGAGVYAVTGQMAGIVGGIVWVPFVVAFIVATLTALSYLELVTKYPQAAGAALYTHKAFGIHFVTFLVTFAVICSGITSASTSANVLAQNLTGGFVVNGWMDEQPSSTVITVIAMLFMVLLAGINLRGVGESVKFNVVLTLVEMAALAIVIGVGFYAMAQGDGDISQVTTFSSPEEKGWFLAITAATSVAFFAMVGFEDSVNMVEETKEPERIFPRTMLTGLGIAVIIYVLVAISVVAVLTPGELAEINEAEGRALLEVVSKGAPDFPIDKVFPFLACFAVANTALINMLMASRLLYGMAKQDVLPRSLSRVSESRRAPYTGDRVLDRPGAGPDLVRRLRRRERGRAQPGQRDRAAPALRVHDRQHRVPGAASRRAEGILPVARAHAARRGRPLRLPRRALGRPRRRRLRDRRGAAGDRRRALGSHLADQPRHPREEDRIPRHRPPRGVTPISP